MYDMNKLFSTLAALMLLVGSIFGQVNTSTTVTAATHSYDASGALGANLIATAQYISAITVVNSATGGNVNFMFYDSANSRWRSTNSISAVSYVTTAADLTAAGTMGANPFGTVSSTNVLTRVGTERTQATTFAAAAAAGSERPRILVGSSVFGTTTIYTFDPPYLAARGVGFTNSAPTGGANFTVTVTSTPVATTP